MEIVCNMGFPPIPEDMQKEGYVYCSQITQDFGVSYSTIKKYAEENGVKPKHTYAGTRHYILYRTEDFSGFGEWFSLRPKKRIRGVGLPGESGKWLGAKKSEIKEIVDEEDDDFSYQSIARRHVNIEEKRNRLREIYKKYKIIDSIDSILSASGSVVEEMEKVLFYFLGEELTGDEIRCLEKLEEAIGSLNSISPDRKDAFIGVFIRLPQNQYKSAHKNMISIYERYGGWPVGGDNEFKELMIKTVTGKPHGSSGHVL